ncbi:hypothetical protein ACFFF7_11810 [Novosphingobium aquiterrae]|uniref:Uncharacterized protein n=1 Tax=Novosphingobium aquiterrae TaxID=624388 RepID=A0ABV6PJT7_9SPHN
MSESASNGALVERLARRRTRILPVLGLFMIIQQSAYFAHGDGSRLVDQVRISAWVVTSAMILLVLTTGGFWLRSHEVRAMLDDEGTRANRAAALSLGFLCAMLTAMILFVLQRVWAFTAGEAIHLIVTAGVFSALIRFSILERRALG